MKIRPLLFAGLILSAFTFNSCEDDVLTTDFSVTLSQDFVVTEINDSVFIKDTIVDATDQSGDIEKYKEQIETVSVEKVTYLLTSFTGDNTHELETGVLTLSDTAGANAQNIVQLSNVNLMNLLNNETELAVNTGAAELLSTLVKESPHTFKLHTEGQVNKTAFDFTIRIKIYLNIKAKVL
ncbi:MAG: hypothetical protein AB9842_04885 [Bacteroidales bacterium]